MKLLVFDTAYTYELLKKRGIEEIVTARNIDGFFEKVINANFSAGLLKLRDKTLTKNTTYRLNDKSYIVESNFVFLSNFKFMKPVCIILGLMKFIVQIFNICKNEKFDFVRSEDPLINGLCGYLFSKLFNKPLIISVWGNPDLIRKNKNKPMMRYLLSPKIEKMIEKFVLLRAHKVLVSCNDDKKFVLKLGIKKEKIFLYSIITALEKIHFDLPKKKFDVFSRYSQNSFKLVTVSRLEREKNVLDLIYMMNEFQIRKNNIELYIIGEGSMRNEIIDKINSFKLNRKIFLLGDKPQDFTAKSLRTADLIISPLTGRALFESLLSGTPVIAYDVNIHKDYIIQGVNGILVEDRNYKKLAKSVLSIKTEPTFLKKIGKNARGIALKKFNVKSITQIQKQMYIDLICVDK